MASVTRSNRRAEGLHPHQHVVSVNASPPLTRSGLGPSLFHQASSATGGVSGARTKRALDATDRDFETVKPKRTRIAVEILARPPRQIDALKVQPPPPPIPRQPTVLPATANRPVGAVFTPQTAPTAPTTTPTAVLSEHDPNITKHQAKVINGIKHELDRLQSQPADTKEQQGRKLRSQEATRFKSELSAYFPDYDEVIGNDPKEQHLWTIETPIVVVDSHQTSAGVESQRSSAPRPHYYLPPNFAFPIRGYGDALFTEVYDSQRIDFGFLETRHKNQNLEDTLPDALFEPVHKRAERLERSIRNTEKGRAQHEKDQIIRLLGGLQGHDWLRVMGVSGVTETKKKAFEPAREHFIKGCQGILDKFRNWGLEEKRRKQEKERVLAEQAEQAEKEDKQEEGEEGQPEGEKASQGESHNVEEEADELATSQDDMSEASSPAKQLRQEARARSKLATKGSKKARPARKPNQPTKSPEPPKEFVSFFSKRYERDAALNRHRRAGRKIIAWGHPIPDMLETEFALPDDLLDEDMLKVRERKKRRDRREHRH